MPTNYKRTSNQQSWNAVSMKKAIDAVKNKKLSYNKAAKYFNVPRTTLKRRVEDINIDATGNKKILGRFRSVFSNDQEQEIVLELEASKAVTPPKKRLFNKKKPTCKRKKNQNKSKIPPNTVYEDSDAECPYCGGTFSQSKSNDGWVRCLKCMKWCHDGCAGCEEDSFICDFCKILSNAY